MSSSVAQDMKPNPQFFQVDIKNFVNSTQFSFDIEKCSKILVILLLEGKL